ncbi:MAG: c-type cytochrome [Planctomycetes bacterium]|nr:c-type cytochrome [Planctomycetota bacterium]
MFGPPRSSLQSAVLLGILGSALPAQSQPPSPGQTLDADTGISLPSGFDAEILYVVPKEQGSWVAMAFDPKGRLIVSDQDDKGCFRVTLPDPESPSRPVMVEPLPDFPWEPTEWGRRTVGGALGFLCAFDSVYMSSMHGFYRIRDTDGDDRYDEFVRQKRLYNGWEHSAHSIILSAERDALYLVSGNHSRLPDGVDTLLPRVWANDSLLPAMPDPQGHARGIGPPGGWICRISPDGKRWTMIASGLRNSVDLAIDQAGELFTYDSDLEFDIGSPWYRPTRVNHVTSASEFGWRSGSAKWPAYFEDSNGAVVDIGPGSPTAMAFAYQARFPRAYRDKLFLCDWTFGTVYTVDLIESGSSYEGKASVFLHGQPLNIAAMRFGPDGHMYFLVGGRNTDSKLYRIRWVGAAIDETPIPARTRNQTLRDLRRSLEAFHGTPSHGAAAIEAAWPHLGHADRPIRYAARVAIESQTLELWRERALAEREPRALIQAAIALCRHADAEAGPRVHAQLARVALDALDTQDRLALLRAWQLRLIRLAPPTAAEREGLIALLDPHYPSGEAALDAELCRVLAYLDAPTVVGKTIALMKTTATAALAYDARMLERHEYGKAILAAMANTPNVQNIHYAYCLRRVKDGWSLEDRKYYFGWLGETLEKSGGKSFAGYIRAIREDAIEHLPDDTKAAVAWLLGEVGKVSLADLPTPEGPPRAWTVDEAARLFAEPLRGRSFARGKRMFAAGRCVVCHRFEGNGGYAGPDLGSVGSRYSVRDILTAIIDPSDSISDQYAASLVTLNDGNRLWGRVISRDDSELKLATNPYDLGAVEVVRSDEVARIEMSPASLMPPATIHLMNADELSDLIAYLLSGGDEEHAVFQKR